MGNCCACLKSAGAVDGSSVEMKQRGKGGAGGGASGKMAPSLTVSRRMSAPSVAIDGEMVVSVACDVLCICVCLSDVLVLWLEYFSTLQHTYQVLESTASCLLVHLPTNPMPMRQCVNVPISNSTLTTFSFNITS